MDIVASGSIPHTASGIATVVTHPAATYSGPAAKIDAYAADTARNRKLARHNHCITACCMETWGCLSEQFHHFLTRIGALAAQQDRSRGLPHTNRLRKWYALIYRMHLAPQRGTLPDLLPAPIFYDQSAYEQPDSTYETTRSKALAALTAHHQHVPRPQSDSSTHNTYNSPVPRAPVKRISFKDSYHYWSISCTKYCVFTSTSQSTAKASHYHNLPHSFLNRVSLWGMTNAPQTLWRAVVVVVVVVAVVVDVVVAVVAVGAAVVVVGHQQLWHSSSGSSSSSSSSSSIRRS